jgi:AAA+ ATPase superfamily predicted ATPase
MAHELSRKEIKEKISEGYVRATIIFEIVGEPKEHVEKSIKMFIENIREDKQIITISEDYEETIKLEDGMYSTAAEVEYLIVGLEKLTWLAFNYMPASIEIHEPKELTFREKDFSTWLNDLLAKLHEVNTVHTSLNMQNQQMLRSLEAAISNSILIVTEQPSLPKEISKKIGVVEEQVLLFLEALLKENKIRKEGKKFVRIS